MSKIPEEDYDPDVLKMHADIAMAYEGHGFDNVLNSFVSHIGGLASDFDMTEREVADLGGSVSKGILEAFKEHEARTKKLPN